jgi:hypothetical protein
MFGTRHDWLPSSTIDAGEYHPRNEDSLARNSQTTEFDTKLLPSWFGVCIRWLIVMFMV